MHALSPDLHDSATDAGRSAPSTTGFLDGGGEMGARLRAFEWSRHPLGPPAGWPASLRTVVRLMLTTNHPAFIFWGPEHRGLYNDAYSRSLGPEKHPAILGIPGIEAWQEIWPIIGPQIDQVMAGRGATWHENQLVPILRNGRLEPVWWTYSFGPIDEPEAPSGVGGVLVLCTETTVQVLEQAALKATDERWKSLFEQAPGFMCILTGPDHRFEFANPRYHELLHQQTLIGRRVVEAVPEVAAQGFIALLDEVYRSGQAHTGSAVPLRLRSADGAERLHHLDFVYQPIRDASGAISGIFVLGSDVSERVATHSALALSEARYRALADRLPGGAVFVVDRSLRYVTVAGEALKTAGYTPEHFLGRTVAEVLGPDATRSQEAHYRRALAGEPFEVEHLDHGRFFLTRGTPLLDPDGAVYAVLAASYDITERRSAEEKLRVASARLLGTMAAAEVGLWSWDPRTGKIEHDLNLARLYGFGDRIETDPALHYARIHPDDAPAVRAAIAAALDSGRFYVREYRVVHPDGSVLWLAARGTAQRDDQGEQTLIAGLVIDISDLKALEQSLLEADRQKDEFLAILAHELRNPLAPLLNVTRILANESLPAAQLAWCRDVIGRQVRQMALLLDDLLDVSRIKQRRLRLARQPLSIDSVIEAAVETAMPLIEARAHRLQTRLPPEALFVDADPSRLAQVLANLLNNAARYTGSGGEIVIEAEERDGVARISVSDNGIGLHAADTGRIFEMFSQVEAAGGPARGGLGIGLALVKGLVELHGGSVHAESAGPGLGSRFVVELPALPANALAAAVAPVAAEALGGARKILIADDNVDAAESLSELLRTLGYATRVAHDGREALAAFSAFTPDAVLLDIGMPELSGYDVAERIRKTPHGSKVLLAALTGWGQEHDKRRSTAAGFDLHFTKPVDPEALIAALGKHLPGGDGEPA